MSTPEMHCDDCGRLDHAVLDGYAVGERLLEGVLFDIRIRPEGTVVATAPPATRLAVGRGAPALMAEYATEIDLWQCPHCGADIDNPLLAED